MMLRSPSARLPAWLLWALAAVAVAGAAGCGESVTIGDGGGGLGGSPTGSGGHGAAAGGSAAAGADGGSGNGVWTECSSPSGYRICGGPYGCPVDSVECNICLDEEGAAAGEVSTCLTEAMMEFGVSACYLCPDGSICLAANSDAKEALSCAPYELGVLYDQSGAGERVRYADIGLWTGDPLPMPETCPTPSGVPICGGHCGGCPAGQICTGRAPLHPYGICIQDWSPSCRLPDVPCGSGEGCFIFTVEPEAQPLADRHGYCLELGLCQSIATGLPGGGKCVP